MKIWHEHIEDWHASATLVWLRNRLGTGMEMEKAKRCGEPVAILSPRISDKPELAPHWVHSSICKLILGRCSCFIIMGQQVVVYQLTDSSQADDHTAGIPYDNVVFCQHKNFNQNWGRSTLGSKISVLSVSEICMMMGSRFLSLRTTSRVFKVCTCHLVCEKVVGPKPDQPDSLLRPWLFACKNCPHVCPFQPNTVAHDWWKFNVSFEVHQASWMKQRRL